jgi:hypothetical protein
MATFVSSSQLTATVSAALLLTASIHVEIWDGIEGTLVSRSSSVPFQVTSSPPNSSCIDFLYLPSTISVGADVTITLNRSNLGRYVHFVWSTAFLDDQ